jgi:diacylglycerol kinase
MIRKSKRAISGFFSVITAETSIRFMTVVGVGVLVFAWWEQVTRMELIVLLVVVFSIIVLEGINTILERVIDLVEPRYKDVVREIKDGLAGLVLLASIGSVVVGLIIFWPYIVKHFG